jgi:hypothetical protein
VTGKDGKDGKDGKEGKDGRWRVHIEGDAINECHANPPFLLTPTFPSFQSFPTFPSFPSYLLYRSSANSTMRSISLGYSRPAAAADMANSLARSR